MGGAGAPAAPNLHAHTRVRDDVAHVGGPSPVLCDDPERRPLETIAVSGTSGRASKGVDHAPVYLVRRYLVRARQRPRGRPRASRWTRTGAGTTSSCTSTCR